MADNTTKIISQLDFEAIKSNLSAFIANNSDFTDYNFEGSGLSFITDLLAYNTHYNAVYLNMAINENFIDTAQTRSSIVSLAKNFGYTPRSKKSSIAELSFTIDEPVTAKQNGNTIFLEQSNYFTGVVDGITYIFSPIESVSATSSSGKYTFSDVKVREGSYVTIKYTVTGAASEKFLINNFDIDLESIQVTVQNSVSDTNITTFDLISDITTLTPDSNIFYLFETTSRSFQIQFGDGVLGKKLTAGNIVNITYQTSSGSDGNNCSSFTLSNSIDSRFTYGDLDFTNVVTSYGGDSEESLDSIRLNALQNFRTQGRAVTAADYKFFIERDYPLAQTVSVWGGQDNGPYPIYGKVFISFKPDGEFFISQAAKQNILDNIISNKNMVSVIPEIVDPEYTFIQIDSSVKFNPNATILTAAQIKSKVVSTIQNYNTTTLTKFGTNFSYSKFTTLIDESDSSILGNITRISLRKNMNVTVNTALTYMFTFQNQIHPGSVTSKYAFKAENDPTLGNTTSSLQLDDDENGKIRIFKYAEDNTGTKIILNANAGTVDYALGVVTLDKFKPSQVNSDNTIDIVCKPAEYSIGDISSYRNNILTMIDTDIIVDVKEA